MVKKVARAVMSEFPGLIAMVPDAPALRRDRIAIATSIAVHVCVLTALASLPRAPLPTTDPDERTLLISQLIQIERRPAPAVAHVNRAPAVPAAPAMRAARPVIHAAVATGHAEHRMVVATEARAAYTPAEPPPKARLPVTSYVPVRVAVATPQARIETAALPAPTAPPAAPAPTAVPAAREDGIGNFGETYPASVEPGLRATLFSGVSGIVVRVTVDESGHAMSIEFLRAPADASQREEVRTRLLAARFIPANCNGLRCIGTLELKN